MNPSDLTLKAFLESKNIGAIEETAEDILLAYGHTAESLPYTEMLCLRPKEKKPSPEQFPTLITEYLVALDFESIHISRLIPNKEFPPAPEAVQYLWKFQANDEDHDRSIITVIVFPEYVMFNSMA